MKELFYSLDFVKNQSNKNLFNVVSFFAGGGGSSTGYRLAGGKVLLINEFVESAWQTYKANYPETILMPDDIRKINGEAVLNLIGLKRGELDLLDGSPPCASFSIAGQKDKLWGTVKKYSDTFQQTDDLFYEFARILKEMMPKVFVCENVKGLTLGASSKKLGKEQLDMFNSQDDTILHSLINCGYNVRYKVLNAKDFGIPQNRERTIFIGVRKDLNIIPSFPIIKKSAPSLGDALNTETLAIENNLFFKNENPKVLFKQGNCFIQHSHCFNYKQKSTIIKHGVNVSQKDRSKSVDEIFVDSYKDVSPTILSQYKGLANGLVLCQFQDGSKEIRKLTIPELKVICGFPLDYILLGSTTKQWERLGRAVPPLMMKSIAEHIYQTVLSKIE